ncbi:zinc finger transcription factor 1 [Colletotrichum tofieldiae]|nr:zinc finger transcription factor 1 [Colletotrichum tofieldiae]
MEGFYAGTLPPILCASISAASAVFVSQSREARLQSIQWAKEVEGWIMENLNDFKTLTMQLLALSIFQNSAYRQLGKAWIMVGIATRQILGSQLNTDRPAAGEGQLNEIQKECQGRLVWHTWNMDKILSAGVDDFTTFPDRSMRLPLPSSEYAFQLGLVKPAAKLSDGFRGLKSFDTSARSYILVLSNIRSQIFTFVQPQHLSSPPGKSETNMV